MGKYKQTLKPKYVPLNRFTFLRSVKDFPANLRRYLSKKDTKYKYTTICGVCEKPSLFVFEVQGRDEGTITVCTNPDCPSYLELEYTPARGGP